MYIGTHISMRLFQTLSVPPSPQASVDGAESLLKKQEEFEMTSQPHDGRVKALSEQANRLIQAGHYDSERWGVA